MEIGVGFAPTNKEFAIPPINYSLNFLQLNCKILSTSKINYQLTLEVGLVFFHEYKKLAKNNGLSFTF